MPDREVLNTNTENAEWKELSSKDIIELAEKTGKSVQNKLKDSLKNEKIKFDFLSVWKQFLEWKDLNFMLNMSDYREYNNLEVEQQKLYKIVYFLTGLEYWNTNPFLGDCHIFLENQKAETPDNSNETEEVDPTVPQSDDSEQNIANPSDAQKNPAPNITEENDAKNTQTQDSSAEQDPKLEATKTAETNETIKYSEIKELSDWIFEWKYANGDRDRRAWEGPAYQTCRHIKNWNETITQYETYWQVRNGKLYAYTDKNETKTVEAPLADFDHNNVRSTLFSLDALWLTKEQLDLPEAKEKILQLLKDRLKKLNSKEFKRLWNYYEPEQKIREIGISIEKALEELFVPKIIESLKKWENLVMPHPWISRDSLSKAKMYHNISASWSWRIKDIKPISVFYWTQKEENDRNIAFCLYKSSI